MKVLIVTDTYPPNVNGAALATERLAKELVKKKHEVAIIAPSTSFRSFKRKQGTIAIYRVRSVPVLLEKAQDFRVSPQPLHAKQIRKIVKEVKPDIIHISEPWFLGMSAINVAKELHIPIISTHHFMPENLIHYLRLPDKLEQMITRTIWKWYARLCSDLNLVICPTQTAADILKRYNPGVELKVISNGIDLEKFNNNNNGDHLKKRYNLPDKDTLLFVGRLDKEKNINVLIRAIALIQDKIDFHLVIVGKGKEEATLKRLAAALGVLSKITFTRYLPEKDLPDIYKVADIFIMPGIAELQSLVTMEAMASGLPVIAANAVALPHLVKNDENGFLFRPGDEKDLAKKILLLLQDTTLRASMGKMSEKIIKEHDIKTTVAEMEETYKQVIAGYVPSLRAVVVNKKNVLRDIKKLQVKKSAPSQLK